MGPYLEKTKHVQYGAMHDALLDHDKSAQTYPARKKLKCSLLPKSLLSQYQVLLLLLSRSPGAPGNNACGDVQLPPCPFCSLLHGAPMDPDSTKMQMETGAVESSLSSGLSHVPGT